MADHADRIYQARDPRKWSRPAHLFNVSKGIECTPTHFDRAKSPGTDSKALRVLRPGYYKLRNERVYSHIVRHHGPTLTRDIITVMERKKTKNKLVRNSGESRSDSRPRF